MKKKHTISICKNLIPLLFLIISVPVHAKYFKALDISNGLPNNTVKCICQDEQGFVWMGTFDGLCRFDGENFTIFRHNPADSLSLINNHVESIKSVDTGLWIGTQNGLNFYSHSDNHFYPCYHRLANGKKGNILKPIKTIICIKEHVFVLNLQRELLMRTDEAYTFQTCTYLKKESILSITAYKDSLLLARTNIGLRLINPKDETIVSRIDFKEKYSDDNILYYSEVSDAVYIGYGIGYASDAFKINKDMQFEPWEVYIPSDIKTVTDYHGKVFFGTDGGGLVSMDGNILQRFTPSNSNISSDAVHSLLADKDENLWVGTYRGGVNLCSSHYSWFNTLSRANGQLTQGIVTAIYPKKNLLYIGLDGGGLNIYDRNTGKTTAQTTANSHIAGNHILSIIGDSKHVWMGIYGKGLCRYSPDANSFRTFPLPPIDGRSNSNRLWEIKDDGRGYIWVIGESVYLFHKSTETFTILKDLDGVSASGIEFDGNVAWLSSTTSGLYKLDRMTGKIIKHYFKESEETPIADNSIRYIFVDSKHYVWFSTEYSGLYKLESESDSITSYDAKNGLTERSVVSIQEDESGYYWMGTANGLFRYDPQNHTFIRFGKEDNLPFVQFNYNACASQDGLFYFGAIGGLTWLRPEEIKYVQRPNKVYLTELELLNKDKKTYHLYGTEPATISLPYDQNFFTIHFSTPEFISPNKIHFTCYMKNFEEGWQEIGQNRKIPYTNVPPGEYTFYVKATDSDGRWNEHASSLRILISPPWWKTEWATALWCLLVLSLLSAIFRFYQHELDIKHTLYLKEIEKNTAKSISEAKLNFFTNITHELRTPIFLITAPLEELLSSGKGPVQVPKSYLTAMYRNAMRLNKLISRIIDFRKLESGKLKLKLQRQNAVAFCKELTVDYEALCQQKNILFYFQPSKTIIMLDFDPEKLETILSNLISNAFKYTPEGGRIIFSITEADAAVVFTVEDNGIGIAKEYHEAIFDSFFQVDPSKASAMGDGIGLSFVKHLVELHKGEVKVESRPEHGSQFSFTIPQTKQTDKEAPSATTFVADEEVKCLSGLPETVSVQSPTNARSILIIDDEKETVEILERFLIADFKIWKAGNGLDGLNIAREALPDLIICDVMMPKMDGTEFLSIMKADKKLAHIPIIMFTAKNSEEDQIAAFDNGADAYLTKPISLKYLRKRIDHLLARSESVEVTQLIAKTDKNYTKEEQRFLLRCREIIDDNLTNADFDVMILASELGMSHSSLYRKVKVVTGMTIIEFINEYRIFKAVQYFKEGESNISSVSVKCGFNDLKNFRVAFKRKMGMTPSQYLQQL
ncbi:MAG: ATP-binding protein [Bacteroides sp.]|nr:ATP-binding protein [Bacteroides sp.]